MLQSAVLFRCKEDTTVDITASLVLGFQSFLFLLTLIDKS